MRAIICDCCNKNITYDDCYAVPSSETDSSGGLDRLEEWIHAMPGRVSRIVCKEDFDDYLDIQANQLAKRAKVVLADIPPALREAAYSAAKKRAQVYLDGNVGGTSVGPVKPANQRNGCLNASNTLCKTATGTGKRPGNDLNQLLGKILDTNQKRMPLLHKISLKKCIYLNILFFFVFSCFLGALASVLIGNSINITDAHRYIFLVSSIGVWLGSNILIVKAAKKSRAAKLKKLTAEASICIRQLELQFPAIFDATGGKNALQEFTLDKALKLDCPICGNTYLIGINATITSLDDVFGFMMRQGTMIFGASGSAERMAASTPDLVGPYQASWSKEEWAEKRLQTSEKVKKIRAALRLGQQPQWVCYNCTEKNHPNPYPGNWVPVLENPRESAFMTFMACLLVITLICFLSLPILSSYNNSHMSTIALIYLFVIPALSFWLAMRVYFKKRKAVESALEKERQ